ncbi:MAG: PadR family transcriptional regulator [Thermoplasmatota archaeon]
MRTTGSVEDYRKKFNKELKTGLLGMVLLHIIAFSDKSLYGYWIIKEIERRSQGEFLLPEGTVYPILNSLESRGFLESYWGRGREGPRRKYYRATEAGRSYLKVIISDWKFVSRTVDEIIDIEED